MLVAIKELVDVIETFNKKSYFVQLLSSWMFTNRLGEAESAVDKARDDFSVSFSPGPGARTWGGPIAHGAMKSAVRGPATLRWLDVFPQT